MKLRLALALSLTLAALGRAELTVTASSGDLLEKELAAATQDVELQLPYLADDGLIASLRRCAGRGVTVRVVLRAESQSNRAAAKALREAGVQVRWLPEGLDADNMRMLLRDKAKAWVGSFTGSRSSLRVRREVLASTEGAEAVKGLYDWFEAAWAASSVELPGSVKAEEELEALPDPRTLVEDEPKVKTKRR